MKFSLACLAAVTVNALDDPDRKYTNKNTFMVSNPPKWWNNHGAEKRHQQLVRNTDKLFDAHFPGMKAEEKLKLLYEDLINDAFRIKGSCEPGSSRKRRAFTDQEEGDDEAAAEEEVDQDPLEDDSNSKTRKVVGEINADAKKYNLNVARWIKYEVYDLGGECEFLGLKMLRRTDRLRHYMYYAYCKQVDREQDFCDFFWGKWNGAHPRDHKKPINKYPAPARPENL